MSLSCAEPVTVHALLAAFHFPCIANGWGPAIREIGRGGGKVDKSEVVWTSYYKSVPNADNKEEKSANNH